jgi:hypothetical protein
LSDSSEAAPQRTDPLAGETAQLARRALFAFILTFIAARTVVLLIMAHRMPTLTFDEFGMWLHLGGSYWQRASVDAIIVVAALLGLLGFATAIRRFEALHARASIALLIALVVFGAVLYDASQRIGRIEGPRLEALEASSSP